MSNPSVCAVMLVNGRPKMVARAVLSFNEQTYKRNRLLIYDTGPMPETYPDYPPYILYHSYPQPGVSIGLLRNQANEFAMIGAQPAELDIIVHLDSDDWSHPRRIEEQVALLQVSGKECVGYRDMLFWNETEGQFCGAWLYTGGPNYCIGTSLCYWRRVWEERPFEDLPKGPTGQGEDDAWLRGVDHLGALSIFDGEPKMIASIHGSNTSSMAALAIRRGASEMKRAPEFDTYCRERMAL